MKLKIRYEEKYEVLEVSSEEMWVTLSLEDGENLTQEEKEIMIQDAFEEKFNKPEYNSWHKFDRHRGNLKQQFRKDDEDAGDSSNSDGNTPITENTETSTAAQEESEPAATENTRQPDSDRRLRLTLDDSVTVYATLVDSLAVDLFVEQLPFTIDLFRNPN